MKEFIMQYPYEVGAYFIGAVLIIVFAVGYALTLKDALNDYVEELKEQY